MSNIQDTITALVRDYEKRLGVLEETLQKLTVGQSQYIVEAFFKLGSIADNTATSVFSITTTNETGDADGGTYSVYVHALITHAGASTPSNSASKSFMAHFTRAMRADGTNGTNSAVSEISESASAATTSATRDIDTVTMTVVETSEYLNVVKFLIDLTGSGVTVGLVHCYVRLVYQGFLTAPVLTQL
jgi:hypothetical protein